MGAKRRPHVPFYVDDFVAGTAHMTTIEVGIYIRLLCHCYGKRMGVPSQPHRLAIIAGCTVEELEQAWEIVGEHFVESSDGTLHNPRVDAILDDIETYQQRQSEAGKAGARKRWRKDGNPNGTPIGTPIGNPNGRTDGESMPSTSTSKESYTQDLLQDRSTEKTNNSTAAARSEDPGTAHTGPPQSKRQANPAKTIPPQREWVDLHFVEIGLNEIEADKFWNFYSSKGWYVGKNKMKDWHSAAQNWKRRYLEDRKRETRNGTSKAEQRDQRRRERLERAWQEAGVDPHAAGESGGMLPYRLE